MMGNPTRDGTSGRPIVGQLVGSSEALAAAKSGAGPTTTTAAPSS